MSETLVIGHRNPDIDAICSAIGYAEFKRRTGLKDAVGHGAAIATTGPISC
jgi:inorganic pyrophosphatase/exopolyphosphatase